MTIIKIIFYFLGSYKIFDYVCVDFNQHYKMDIRSIIKQKGYTIEQVADKMGISRVTLMQNISRNPTISTLRRVADALGCKVNDFFQDELPEEDKNSIICPKCGAKFTLKE